MNSFAEAAIKQVEHQAVGGAKRTVKKSSKQDTKKQTQKSDKKTQQKQQDRSSQDKKKQSAKKGGAIVDDVKNLAVPFAILLAKEGLSKMFPKTAKSSSPVKSSVSAASASKSSSSRRRTMSGGSCNLGCTAQTGGQAAKQLFELQTEIDRFLQKY